MGVYYITNLCIGTFGTLNVSNATRKIKIADDKIVEQHEWTRGYVDFEALRAYCDKRDINISEFSHGDVFLEEVGCSTMEMDPCYWSSFIKVKKCFCNDKTKTWLTACVICKEKTDILMSDWERQWECCHIVNAICGLPEYVCDTCTEQGWYSTAGSGGGTYHINNKTGEARKG